MLVIIAQFRPLAYYEIPESVVDSGMMYGADHFWASLDSLMAAVISLSL